MDRVICCWIAEFLVRQPDTSHVVKKLLPELELSNDDIRLKKTLVLRSIADEIAEGSISETILDSLEILEELDRKEGSKMTESMKRAYCAVAVECTVKYLVVGEFNKGKYLDALKRIWEKRIQGLQRSGTSELVCSSEELGKRREEIEAAVWDKKVCMVLTKRNTRNDALNSVRDYIVEAFAMMGPAYLEVAVRKTMEMNQGPDMDGARDGTLENNARREPDGVGDEMVDRAEGQKFDDKEIGDDASRLPFSEVALAKGKEICKNMLREKNIAHWRCHVGSIEISDAEESNAEPLYSKCDPILNPEYNKVQGELNTSISELGATLKDTLRNALQVAETLRPRTVKESIKMETQGNHLNDARKCTLMEWNSTAHTYEWDDLTDDSPIGASSSTDRIHLPTNKRMTLSPLKRQTFAKLGGRRKPKKWSLEEEDVLRNAVKKYGKGNWKLILNLHHDVFLERNEGDLKDKWRNMMR